MQIYIDKLNELNRHRYEIVKNEKCFSPFHEWEESRLKNLLLLAKERILNNDEILVRENQE